jgi:hypothetical protein
MNPFSKSVWITPAAFGAVSPMLIVQARTSFTPAVKYVCNFNNIKKLVAICDFIFIGSFLPSYLKTILILLFYKLFSKNRRQENLSAEIKTWFKSLA